MKGRNSNMGHATAKFCVECGCQGIPWSPVSRLGNIVDHYCEAHRDLRAIKTIDPLTGVVTIIKASGIKSEVAV